jgi:hypothetical protein
MSEPATPEPPAPAIGPALGQIARDVFGLDLRSLALLRILLALLVLWDLAGRIPDLLAFYTDDGVLPRSLFYNYNQLVDVGPISIHLFFGSFYWQFILILVATVFALLMLVGWHTRLVTFISWFLLISAHGRNGLILHGGDNLLRVYLFWAMFLPLGARYSFDAVRTAPPRSVTVFSAASVAFLLQLCMLYWFAAALKRGDEWHREGTAIWYSLNVDEFTTRFGRFLLQLPALLRVFTRVTILLEWYGPFLLFVPYGTAAIRLVLIPVFILFHLGLGLSLELGNFPVVCCAGWLALLPGLFWDRLAAWCRTPRRAALTVYHPGDDGLRAWLGFLFLADVKTATSPGDDWRAVDSQGKEHVGVEAFLYLVWMSPLWWPLTPLLRWLGIAGVFYRRALASVAPTVLAHAEPVPLPAVVNVCLVFLIGYVFLWNLRTTSKEYLKIMPLQDNALGDALGLAQGWGLFAPAPPHHGAWYVVEGQLPNGRGVELFQDGPLTFDRPELVSATYRDPRWRKYLMNIAPPEPLIDLAFQTNGEQVSIESLSKAATEAWGDKGQAIANLDLIRGIHRSYFANYLFTRWNSTHSSSEQIETLAIWYLVQETTPDGKAPAVKRIRLWQSPSRVGS